MKALLTATLLSLTLIMAGCAALTSDQGTFVVQYATIKLIEQSDEVSAQNVLDTTNKVRGIVEENEELTMSSLASGFRQRVDISSLQPSDQLLVSAIISRIQSTVSERLDTNKSFFGIEQTTTILQLLDDVDEAASLYVK